MKKSLLFLLLFTIAAFGSLFAQENATGAIFNEAVYQSLPRKAVQYSKALDVLPRAFSLKQYAPYPGNQNPYSTCTAWATAYAGRTIMESYSLGRQNRTETTTNVFSPVFVYKSVSKNPSCDTGIQIFDALDIIVNPGIPRRSSAEQTSDFKFIPLSGFTQSPKFPISSYKTIYDARRTENNSASWILSIKESLFNGKPVVIGMYVPLSFHLVKASPWRPNPSENPNPKTGYHAMCVVGYDDSQYGGAFEIQNSWGEGWGEKGYIWVQYEVFARFVKEAYEMVENLSTRKDAALFSGFVDIEVENSQGGMPVRFDERGFYRTVKSWPSGTVFRFLMGNDQPAYVYAFGADSATKNTIRIFPLKETLESPVLDHAKNVIAFPGEYDWIEMDNVTGTDYLVVLFAKQELDIDSIRAKFAAASGTFNERVAAAVGSNFVSPKNIQYEKDRIKFKGSSANRSAVMGLLLAIDHN